MFDGLMKCANFLSLDIKSSGVVFLASKRPELGQDEWSPIQVLGSGVDHFPGFRGHHTHSKLGELWCPWNPRTFVRWLTAKGEKVVTIRWHRSLNRINTDHLN